MKPEREIEVYGCPEYGSSFDYSDIDYWHESATLLFNNRVKCSSSLEFTKNYIREIQESGDRLIKLLQDRKNTAKWQSKSCDAFIQDIKDRNKRSEIAIMEMMVFR